MKTIRASDNDPLNVDDHRKRPTDYDLRICTWNVRTLNREGALIQLADALDKIKADITAIQEVRWLGQACSKQASCDIYYSCHAERRELGCGFVVGRRLRHHVSRFTPVNERLATIRIKARFFHISLICAHAPTEEKDDSVKDAFYARLEEIYDRCPAHDVKILLGDFNANVGREGVFGSTVGKFSLHETTSNNGLRLIDFVAARNMVVSSTRFQHLDIHKATWLSPDQKTRNQIDHVAIDGRHASSVLDVRTFRGVNIDSDHFLVAAKIRMRLCNAKNVRSTAQRKLDVAKLQSQQTAEAYSAQLSELLHNPNPDPEDVGGLWAHISHSMRTAAEKTIGFRRPPQRNQWYDAECREVNAAKNAAYRRTLQSVATRAVRESYREKRKGERKLFRRKKREKEKREREELEMCSDRNDARKFYQQVKRLTQGFKPGASACRDENGNLVIDTQCTLRLWREHFLKLLAGDDVQNPATEEADSIPPIDDDVEVQPPSPYEVRVAIKRLKSNKAAGSDGLPAELFKAGGDKLIGCMDQLVSKIWLEERMPDD